MDTKVANTCIGERKGKENGNYPMIGGCIEDYYKANAVELTALLSHWC